jgi:hypothetical protein
MHAIECSTALKEWAVICRALETGRQTMLLRKGGIAEGAGGFRAEHDRFWLYPTQFHQTADQLAPEFAPLLNEVDELQTASGQIVVRALAEVAHVQYLSSLDQALALRGLHGWTDDVVRQRFHYKQPGLYLFVLSVSLADQPTLVTESATMAGCKSWVELPQKISTLGVHSVLANAEFQKAIAEIDRRLQG